MSTTTRREVAVSYIGDKNLPILFECELDDINRARSRLAENGIEASVVRQR